MRDSRSQKCKRLSPSLCCLRVCVCVDVSIHHALPHLCLSLWIPYRYRLHMRNVHLAVPAWRDEPLQLRSKIQALAVDKRNFNRRLSARARRFNLHMFQKCAQVTMEAQPELAEMFQQLVPKDVSEHAFWANYANRVKLIVTGFYTSAKDRKFRQEFSSDAGCVILQPFCVKHLVNPA
jgi:hypothetical protein